PNTRPTTTDAAAIEDKLARARGRMHCDHAFYVGGTHENARDLGELERLPGCCGVKVFVGSSTGSLLIADDEGLKAVLAAIRRRAAFHSEDENRLVERKPLARPGDWTSHPDVRDVETALRSSRRLIALARAAGKRIHILHTTTADEIELFALHRDIVTCEITPQHLTMAAPECYERLKSLAQMNPPIRDERHRRGLWRGIELGIADVIGTDHSPHTLEEKARSYPDSPSGMPGVQTLVAVMLTHVAEGRLTLERFVDLTSHGANRVFNIAGKGRLAVGYDADLTIVDLNARRTIRNEDQVNRAGWTAFDGFEAKGWPMATIIRGRIVMRDDEVVAEGLGEPVRFLETLPGE
ncbi:MAG: dihydroorotase, partial [Caulobacteraceae bacterium]